MKYLLIGMTISFVFVVGFVISQPDANAEQAVVEQLVVDNPQAEPVKKCGFDSDCPHGKCKGGQCGACGYDSDCKGWGKCKGGQCGACGFDSDCKGFGKCSSGKCTKSPY